MENEKVKKGSAGIIICTIIIIALIAGLVVMYFTLNGKVVKAEENTEKYISKLEVATGSNKKAITAEEFKNYIIKKEFTINNPDEHRFHSEFLYSLSDGYVTNSTTEEDFQINFFEFKNDDFAKFYHYEVITANDNSIKTELKNEDSLNYSKYAMFRNGMYLVSSRIGNTILYGVISAENQAELDKIINELGY